MCPLVHTHKSYTSLMPNGGHTGRCQRCKMRRRLHVRAEEDYLRFIGAYCDDCLDWIEIDDHHWILFYRMKMADSTMAHPLSLIIAHEVGHIIAEFHVVKGSLI